MARLNTKILSQTGTLFDGYVSHVTFPGEIGSFAVFPSHAPIISSLVKGTIICFQDNGEQQTIPVESGFVEVKADRIIVCVEQESEKQQLKQM